MKKLIAPVVILISCAPQAYAQDAEDSVAKNGFRAELRTSYETPTVSDIDSTDDVYKLGSAFSFGGEVGFDVAVSDKVAVGPYVTYELSSVENSDAGVSIGAEDFLSVGLHAGYAVSENGQVYGKLGYSKLRVKAEIDLGGGTIVSDTSSGSGIGGAIGYEHSFGKNFYGRIEGGYADVGEIDGISFQRRFLGVAAGVRF